MRSFGIGSVLLLLWIAGTAVVEKENAEMEETLDYFVFIYRLGPGWSSERPPLEQPGMPGHFQRMQELADAEILVTGGPFKDLSGAMGIILAASLEHAREIVAHDPVVAEGAMLAEVLPWHPSVTGCIQARDWGAMDVSPR